MLARVVTRIVTEIQFLIKKNEFKQLVYHFCFYLAIKSILSGNRSIRLLYNRMLHRMRATCYRSGYCCCGLIRKSRIASFDVNDLCPTRSLAHRGSAAFVPGKESARGALLIDPSQVQSGAL